ncbi:MAG: prephenate dehydrogenase/arogenate dehydrogenase family protein [Candidatus Methanospirareceae archaeon]
MGRWFSRFFKENGLDVRIVDKAERTEEVAREMGVEFLNIDVLKEGEDLKKVVDTDILLISVPIDITAEVIERIGPLMRKNSLLMDITSVKRIPMEAMERSTRGDVEVLGTHPLFGPTARSIRGQTIVFVPLRRGHLFEFIYDIFKRNGARVEFLDAAEHDRIMAIVQGLPHFILISLAVTLKNLSIDVEASRKYMSPTYDIITDFMGRILHQDPHLYTMIQMNLDMKEAHEAFLTTVKRLYELIQDKDIEGFMKEIKEAKSNFGDTERAMKNSDRLIEEKRKILSML